MIHFSWDMHYVCNYACPYCWFHGKWEEVRCNNIYPGTAQIVKYWENIHKKHGKVQISITGGEPFTYPDFHTIIREISGMHEVGITSNLSCDVDRLVCNEKKCNVGMSYHPIFAKFDVFLEKAIKVKNNGFGDTIMYLAWPPQIQDIPRLKDEFEKHGFRFAVLTFWGKYNGREYPMGYTDEEKSIIDPALGVRGESNAKFQLSPLKTRGKLCNAGTTYALIHPNGDTYRCGGGNWKEQHPPFAQFFSENFSLYDKPMPCESDECPCNEWTFLLVDK